MNINTDFLDCGFMVEAQHRLESHHLEILNYPTRITNNGKRISGRSESSHSYEANTDTLVIESCDEPSLLDIYASVKCEDYTAFDISSAK